MRSASSSSPGRLHSASIKFQKTRQFAVFVLETTPKWLNSSSEQLVIVLTVGVGPFASRPRSLFRFICRVQRGARNGWLAVDKYNSMALLPLAYPLFRVFLSVCGGPSSIFCSWPQPPSSTHGHTTAGRHRNSPSSTPSTPGRAV